jgi:hypothetical protein
MHVHQGTSAALFGQAMVVSSLPGAAGRDNAIRLHLIVGFLT